MRCIKYLLSSLIFCFIVTSYAQNSSIKAADQAFKTFQYSKAIELYKKGFKKIKKNAFEINRVNYQIAECYRIMGDQKRAEQQYLRLEKKNYQKLQPNVLLYLAEIYKQQSDYDKALSYYKKYLKLKPKDTSIDESISTCEKAKNWTDPNNQTKHEIGLFAKFNIKGSSTYCPRWFDMKKQDQIMITSDREGATGKESDTWTGKPFSDIWVSIKSKSKNTEWPGDWSAPILLEDPTNVVNTEVGEGESYRSLKKNLYITRCPHDKKKVLGCYIYQIKPKGKGWGDTIKIDLCPEPYSAVHPYLTNNELTIYFASNMPGGQGGFDIWKATRTKINKPFEKPVNLGSKINTSKQEVYPSLRGDSILYYSSDGLPGIGGLDIFYAKISNDGTVDEPQNMLSPMNSNGDDFGIIFDESFTVDPETKAPYVEKGFFTSNRIDKLKLGVDNIYYFKLKPLLFTLAGFVRDSLTLQYMDDVEVILSGSDGSIIKKQTDVKGYYNFGKDVILPNTTYQISVSKKGYWERNNTATTTTIGLNQNTNLKQDFKLLAIPPEPIVLPEIRYDLAKWDLKDQYKDSLLYVYNVLIKNPKLVIELRSHTDFRDTDKHNDTLSQRRAESCVNFLVNEKKINPNRIVPKGYGERQPRKLDRNITINDVTFTKGTVLTESYINSLKTTKEKEAAHQLNRRTEMFILRSDFIDTAQKISSNTKPSIALVTQRFIPLTYNNNIYEGKCIVNDKQVNYKFDQNSSSVLMSYSFATKLLKEQIITVSDFEKGSEAINEETGLIIDNSILYLSSIMIGEDFIQNVKVTVKKSVTQSLIIGGGYLKEELGEFTLDKDKNQLIFK